MKTLLKGFVADGLSGDIQKRAVLIENSRIIAVEKDIIGSSAADKTVVFKNEIIAPGFIDVHGHSDMSVLAYPDAFSKHSQGITSEIVGNCGLSAFPLTELNREHLAELYKNYGVGFDWKDCRGFLEQTLRRNCRLRIFSFCGHNTLRAAVSGYEKKELNGREFDEMGSLLVSALDSGALGLSTGLLYVPGINADQDELLALMKILAAEDRVYVTHLRSEGSELLESLEETLSLAERAGLRRVGISHFKTAGSLNWHKLERAVELIESFRQRGMDVRTDRYPYTESQTMMSVVLPPPYDKYGDSQITRLLADPQERAEALKQLRNAKDDDYWKRLRLTGSAHPHWKKFCGRKIVEISSDPAALVIESLACDADSSMISAANMSEENLKKIIALPYCSCGSDGNALPQDHPVRPHPRSFGAMCRFIRLLLDMSLPVGDVCRKVSASPAEFFRLDTVGRISAGFCADITVFDPEEIDSDADFADPCRQARGIAAVMCGGEMEYF